MRLCFILEREYSSDQMPRAVAECVQSYGHTVDLLEPQASITSISELGEPRPPQLEYDAYVLKTAPNGPGLSILEAAGAAGMRTVNDWRSIHLVRNKAVAVARARVYGLSMPQTFFSSTASLLRKVATQHYPVVIKPIHGSSNRGVHLVDRPEELGTLGLEEERYFLVQSYVENEGFDVKLYNTGEEVFAVQCASPLHPEVDIAPRMLPLTPELRSIALKFGRVFGLSIYGVDVLSTPHGWVPVDVNDFPSFRNVPDAAERVATSLLRSIKIATQRRSARKRRLPSQINLELSDGSKKVRPPNGPVARCDGGHKCSGDEACICA
jgi:ribosomal protein S6--L-glutamate ligase